MIKFKLKRKVSGRKIKEAKRKIEFDSYNRYENKGLYDKNRLPKRHIENPNIYEGENPIGCAFRNIRLPKKGRKTAWKRFKKNFPYVKVTKSGGKRFDQQKWQEFYDSRRSKKESTGKS